MHSSSFHLPLESINTPNVDLKCPREIIILFLDLSIALFPL